MPQKNALQPPHKYAPWVVVDGQPLYEDYENFVSYICKAYKGSAVTGACAKYSKNAPHKVNLRRISSSVCQKGTQISDVFERVMSELNSWINNIVKFNVAGLL